MTQIYRSVAKASFGSRIRRLPFVLILTLGLLISLMHCAGCGAAYAGSDTTTIAVNESGTPPDVPDQQLPAHSGHCLSHVTAQLDASVSSQLDHGPRAPSFAGDRIPAATAGLPFFKPPRA